MPITTTTGLVDALREYHILSTAQLKEVTGTLQSRCADARALARELLQRGWLTAYQVNQLVQGRGADLLRGEYVLLERLGEGGMGIVFKARHQLMDRVVALKLIRKEQLAHTEAVDRFHREIRLAAQLDHPHLVRAYDAARVGDSHFLVMEYAEGTDLQRLIAKSGPLPVGQACAYMRQAALGLQHASERGLVHRDIKPSNLQVTAHGTTVKILDMGLARSQVADTDKGVVAELTQNRTVMGTPDYMAPEQIVDPRKVDVRADIYSLGCTFYFLLAGRPPFAEGEWQEKLTCHRKVEPQPIEQLRPDVPPPVGAILRKMMAKRPEDRYATPSALAEALAPFAQGADSLPTTAWSGAAKPGTPSAGRTVDANSRVPAAAAQMLSEPTLMVPPSGSSPPAEMGLPLSVYQGLPMEDSRKRLWLLVAGGGAGLVLLLLLVIVLWPKGGATDGGKDSQAKNSSPASPSSPGDKVVPGVGPASSEELIASAGFNNTKGTNSNPAPGVPYPLDAANRTGGAGEPGWAGPWPAHPAATFQSKVVFEGDGALYLTGSVNSGPNYGRQLAQAQTGTFQIEYSLQVPGGSNCHAYLWKAARPVADASGPNWRAHEGKFLLGDGDDNGGLRSWVDTGFKCLPGQWYKVKVRINVPDRTWEFFVDDQPCQASGPLHFRGKADYLDVINFLVEGGVYIDALRVTRPVDRIASSGFNDRIGMNANAQPDSPFPLNTANRPGGEGEPGWKTLWTPSATTIFQTGVVYEGDGALHVTGTQGCRRVLASPQAGKFQVEQYLRVPPRGDFVCYLRKNGNDNDVGPMWRVADGKFSVLNGEQAQWIDTGFVCEFDKWYKVTVRIDVPRATWEFLVNDQQFVPQAPLGFRTRQHLLDQIDYGSFGPEGFYLDAVLVTRWPDADKKH